MIKNLLIPLAVLVMTLVPFFQSELSAQDKAKYQNAVRTLSDPSLYGRSLAGGGIEKAREFITSNINQAATWQYQVFSFPMNLFEGELELKADGKKLELFKDYIVKEFSPSAKGTFPVVHLPAEYITPEKFYNYLNREELKGKFVVIDFGLLMDQFFIDTAVDYNLCISYDNYQHTLGKLGYVAGVILTQKGRPVSYKARAHYNLAFPVIVAEEDAVKDIKEVSVNIEAKMYPRYVAKNIVGWLPGKGETSKYKVLIAHYDHLGIFGKGNIMTGANDNASGAAMMLTLIDYFAKPENRPDESLMFIFTDGEESNLLGSHFYVKSPLKPLEDCTYLVDMDMVGDNATTLSYVMTPEDEPLLKELNAKGGYFTGFNKIEFTDYCDFYPFAMKGIPYAYFSVDGINKDRYYHSPADTYSNFSADRYENCFKLIRDFIVAKQ